ILGSTLSNRHSPISPRHSPIDNALFNQQSVDRQSPIFNPPIVNRQSSTANRRALEPYPHILLGFYVNGIDEADARGIALHDDGTRPCAVAEEADAAHEAAVGD